MAELVEKLLEGGRLSLRLHLYCPIVSVTNVALEAQLAGVSLGKEAKSNTLHVT